VVFTWFVVDIFVLVCLGSPAQT